MTLTLILPLLIKLLKKTNKVNINEEEYNKLDDEEKTTFKIEHKRLLAEKPGVN